MSNNLDATMQVLETLPKFHSTGTNTYMASCPCGDDAHKNGDRNESFSITRQHDRITFKCFAGCDRYSILQKLGLEERQLYLQSDNQDYNATKKDDQATKDYYATRYIVDIYPYTDEYGKLLSQVVKYNKPPAGVNVGRYSQQRPDPNNPNKPIKDIKGVERVLYNLPNVLYAIENDIPIVITEGEKDANTVNFYNSITLDDNIAYVATTSPMGATSWNVHYAKLLQGAKKVIICGDNDKPGRDFAKNVARDISAKVPDAKVYIVDLAEILPDLKVGGDISDYVQDKQNEMISKSILSSDRHKEITCNLYDYFTMYSKEYSPAFYFIKDYEEWLSWEWRGVSMLESIFNSPNFPVNCLTPWLREFVESVAKTCSVYDDMVVAPMFGAFATCLQKHFDIKGRYNHVEPLSMFFTIVAESGDGKSGVIKIVRSPIRKFQANANAFTDVAKSLAKQEIERLEQKQKNLNAKISKTKDDNVEEKKRLETELKDLTTEIETKRKNFPKKTRILFAENATPEALLNNLYENDSVGSIIAPEGGFLKKLGGHYSGQADIDGALQGFTGEDIEVSRIGRPDQYIPDPRLTLVLAIQPKVLRDMMKNQEFVQRGLLARFLVVFPKSKIGTLTYNNQLTPEEEAYHDNCVAVYDNLCEAMLQLKSPAGKKFQLTLSREAFAIYCKFWDEYELKIAPNAELDYDGMIAFAKKFRGIVLRIAGIMHLSEKILSLKAEELKLFPNFDDDLSVSADTIERAIEIGKYFLEHAKICYAPSIATISPADFILRRLKEKFESGSVGYFVRPYDVWYLVQSKRFKNTDAVRPYLNTLAEYGYLKVDESEKQSTSPRGGRPKVDAYILNPHYFVRKQS